MKRFREVDLKKKYIWISVVGIVFLIAVIFLYRSYAIYQEKQEFDVIKGSVPEYMSEYDVSLAVTIDGNISKTFPAKDSGKSVSSIECSKGASASWDYKNWMIKVKNVTETRTKCQVHFVTKYHDSVLNGADPMLKDGLIPVTIDESGVVRKASLGSEWYNYSNKEWANAVVLDDMYVEYAEGEIIPESNIESYFVWIPRYKYKIFNEGNYQTLTNVEKKEQTIEVVFESKEKRVSSGRYVGEWLTHPAFISFDVNGLWVGKFETGYQSATKQEDAEVNGGYSSKVIIKPNVYSWRSIQVAHAFIASYDYRRSMDSHLMKNTEWGAVAYLSHSKYGSQTSVRINNNSSYITGYAATKEPTCGYTGTNEECNKYESTNPGMDGTYTVNYNNNASVVASTTGNRSGVYDMSGGAFEYVMGVMVDQNGNPASGKSDNNNSNFIGILTYPNDGVDKSKTSWTSADGGIPIPEEKYYDKYAYAEDAGHYNGRILGDATGEMGPFANVTYGTQTRQIGSWYADAAWFVGTFSPWFIRGANYDPGMNAGVFTFSRDNGRVTSWISFRVVLSF